MQILDTKYSITKFVLIVLKYVGKTEEGEPEMPLQIGWIRERERAKFTEALQNADLSSLQVTYKKGLVRHEKHVCEIIIDVSLI